MWRLKMRKENKIIAEALNMLINGRYRDKKQYIKELQKDGHTVINGFIIEKDTWCWLIWKPTDSGQEPQYKDEPLVKIVPNTVGYKKDIFKILNHQSWIYL